MGTKLPLARAFLAAVVVSAGGASRAVCEDAAPSAEIDWRDDYAAALADARAQQRQAFLYFAADRAGGRQRAFEQESLPSDEVRRRLADFVCVRLSTAAEFEVEGRAQRLLAHPAFAHLEGGPGVAIIDFADPASRHYRRVVSVYPLHASQPLGPRELTALLNLPGGSLTQRTLLLAVQIHPEHPRSGEAEWHPILVSEAASHAAYQASLNLQGHHHWETRFHRINARLGGGLVSQEVCAESWPGQGLVEGAIECVHSWRQSPGHWEAVSSRPVASGYDLRRGSNGVWYATGIFARRG